MKSWFMESGTDAATLELRETPRPEPGPQQLLVRMHAASLNRGEFILGHGLHKAGAARAIGMEGAGEIAGLGAGVNGLRVGERVMGRCPGAFSEYAVMDAREAIAMPPDLSWEAGAAVPLTFLVVHDMLVAQGRLKAGEWVLVTGVSSGVGVAHMEADRHVGKIVLAIAGT